jgi:MFS family permease
MQSTHENQLRQIYTHRCVLALIIASASYLIETTSFPIFLQSISNFEEKQWNLYLIYYYNFAIVLGIVICPILSFKIVSGKIFIYGVILYTFGSCSLTITDNEVLYIWSRIVQGLGAGIFSPVVPSLIAEFSEARSYRALTIWSLVSGCVGVVAPFFFAVLIASIGWKIAWIIAAFPAILSMFIYIQNIVPIENEKKSKSSWPQYRNVFNGVVSTTYIFVFFSYGVTTWIIYHVLQNISIDSNLIEMGLVGALPWAFFSVASWIIMRTEEDKIESMIIFATISNSLSVVFYNFEFYICSICLAGFGMAFSNVPTTSVLFSSVKSRLHSLVSSLDILMARLGGGVFIWQISDRAIPYVLPFVLLSSLLMLIKLRTRPVSAEFF